MPKLKRKNTYIGGLDRKAIPQIRNYDCVIACLAMLLRKEYNYIKNKYFIHRNFDKHKGVTLKEELHAIQQEGYTPKVFMRTNTLPKNASIISVKSLNYPNSLHAVFWDGSEMFDPNIYKNRISNGKIKIYNQKLFLQTEKISIVTL